MASAQLLLCTPWHFRGWTMTLQTVKVHIKICCLQSGPEFLSTDWYGTRVMQCASTYFWTGPCGWACGYQMSAHLLRDLDGLAMIISLVLGPYLRINALWYQEFLLKAACGCIWSPTHTQRGLQYQHKYSDQNVLVFICFLCYIFFLSNLFLALSFAPLDVVIVSCMGIIWKGG